MCELAWADACRKPVIVCMEADGSNPHDSLHIRGLATYLVEDLESGIAVARCFFNAPAKPQTTEVFMGLDAPGGDIQTLPRRSF